uniref:Reverse transcriptase domain-containing protein n=1 Tax=Tanacetum cinerariifolium TaxID=118510 RepID=A0A6L2L7Q8_TANCI|nr:reverse transcriptase domain-containing protein [Tanacetum cinerariifolium]
MNELHCSTQYFKANTKSTDTPRGEGKKDKSVAPAKAPILMVSQVTYAAKDPTLENMDYEGEEITFPPVTKVNNAPIVIEAKVFGRRVGRVYMDSGRSCEVIYEHYFEKLNSTIKAFKVDLKTPLVGFSGERSWSVGEIPLEITIGEAPLSRTETLNFVIVRSDSSHNMLLGRIAMQKWGSWSHRCTSHQVSHKKGIGMGIKANPSKVKAVTDLEQPRVLKDIQSLNGKLAAISQFLSKGARRSLPFFKVLKSSKGKKKIQWTDKADKAFKEMKKFVQALSTLTASKESINAVQKEANDRSSFITEKASKIILGSHDNSFHKNINQANTHRALENMPSSQIGNQISFTLTEPPALMAQEQANADRPRRNHVVLVLREKIFSLIVKMKEHKGNLNTMMLESQKWVGYQMSLLDLKVKVASLEAEKASLEAFEASIRWEIKEIKHDRREVVLKVIPYACIELVHSDKLGKLVGRLVSSAITYGWCRAYEQVAEMKDPFDLATMKGYRFLYKKDHTQASNELATATFPWLDEFIANATTPIKALLSKKPPLYRSLLL